MSQELANLMGMPRHELEDWFSSQGEKPFRARQLMRWLYTRGEFDFAAMTDLSATLRERLTTIATTDLPVPVAREDATDGVIKWRLDAGRGQAIETVFIPEDRRGTLCVSSQVGCAMDCPFCATGRQGFNRNLSAAEIVGQVAFVQAYLAGHGNRSVSNVVFMGMGEPLANLRAVTSAIDVLLDDFGFGLSRRRVTVSTSGLVPQIKRLAEAANAALAVSLHAATDKLRDVLVPINRRHPIGELLPACWEYARETGTRDVTFEYVMLAGVNDSDGDAAALARLLRDRPAKVNLIPFNPFPGSEFRCSARPTIDRFRQTLLDAGIVAVTRKTRGDDIQAACGQLAGRVANRVRAPLGSKLQAGTA